MKIVNSGILTKTTIIALIMFGFCLTLSLVSDTFDGDFGWHLRFGKEAWGGNFGYTDTYTYSHYGQDWVNHEWGGDMVFWFLYNHFGYFSLVLLTSLSLWLAFLFVPKVFDTTITPGSVMISILAMLSVRFIIIMRLSMLTPLFLVLLWWSLEKLPRKTYYFWPALLWLWSVFHGSWILGFIVINIYLVGNMLQLLWPKLNYQPTNWTYKTAVGVLFWQAISGLAIMINPYGYKIWQEILLYFTNNFYKLHINEWLPSYTYPIFWAPFIIIAICLTVIYLNIRSRDTVKKITYAQILLFAAFLYSAMQYKRNNLYLILVCVPLLVFVWQYAVKRIKATFPNVNYLGIVLIGVWCLAYTVIYHPTIRYNSDVWQDKELHASYGFPVGATDYLQAKTANQKDVRVFIRYGWGGYLNWRLPNALVYADGRSAATWMADEDKSLLEEYYDYVLKPDQLEKLAKNQVRYIVLPSNLPEYSVPKWSDKLIFTQKDLDIVLSTEPLQVEKDLDKSRQWTKVYTDQISNVWENTASSSSG